MRVMAIERVGVGVVITFTGGEAVLFHAQFLYSVRYADNNVPLSEGEPEEDSDEHP